MFQLRIEQGCQPKVVEFSLFFAVADGAEKLAQIVACCSCELRTEGGQVIACCV